MNLQSAILRGLYLTFLILAVASLGLGCARLSANPLQDLPKTQLGGVVVQGLQDASFNLDSAVTVGALKADDPAAACLHSLLTQLGVGITAPSFTPKVSDLISAGSVLYIRAQQLKQAQGSGLSVSPGCKELMATLMLDAAAAGAKGFPGGGLLPVMR